MLTDRLATAEANVQLLRGIVRATSDQSSRKDARKYMIPASSTLVLSTADAYFLSVSPSEVCFVVLQACSIHDSA